jgi:ABC-2 type transport system permease protein
MELARDTWLIFQHETGLMLKNPASIAITLIQPITYLLLFTPFLKSVMGVSTYGGAFGVYVPSLFAAMGVFNGMFAGFALLAAIRQGVITRCRVTPLSRVSLLLGRLLQYILLIGFQGIVVVVTAIAFGLRVGLGNFLVALWHPFAWGTNAMRAAFQNHIGDPVVWQAILILTGLAVLTVLLSSRLFGREIA